MGNVMAKVVEVTKKVVRQIKNIVRECTIKAIHGVVRFSINHPKYFKVGCYVSGGALLGGLSCVALLPVILPMVGFTSGGVAAGSLAAAWQAMIGNVAAGSLFSILTSAGAGGFGVAIATTLAAGGGIGIGAASGALAALFNDRGPAGAACAPRAIGA